MFALCTVAQELFGDDISTHHQIDKLLDVAEKVLPTLDANDRATVKESIETLNRRVVDACANSQATRKQLQSLALLWQQFQVIVNKAAYYFANSLKRTHNTVGRYFCGRDERSFVVSCRDGYRKSPTGWRKQKDELRM